MELAIGNSRLDTVLGDIAKQEADGIGNAANPALAGGGGVDGAIHRAGGPEILRECREIGGCRVGGAVATGAGRLRAKRVLHMVGPIWRGGGHGEADLLASCYRHALELAEREGLGSVVFPSVSTGVYGYPLEPAAATAVRAIRDFLVSRGKPGLVRMALFDHRTKAAYDLELSKLGGR